MCRRIRVTTASRWFGYSVLRVEKAKMSLAASQPKVNVSVALEMFMWAPIGPRNRFATRYSSQRLCFLLGRRLCRSFNRSSHTKIFNLKSINSLTKPPLSFLNFIQLALVPHRVTRNQPSRLNQKLKSVDLHHSDVNVCRVVLAGACTDARH